MNTIVKKLVGKCLNRFLNSNLVSFDGSIIVMYHRIVREVRPDTLDKALFISEQSFTENLLFLKKNFEIISLSEWLDLRGAKRRYCVVTFDDGWLDNYVIAFPILRALGIPATIFVNTALVGTMQVPWFDRLQSILQMATIDDKYLLVKLLFEKYRFEYLPTFITNLVYLYWVIRERLLKVSPLLVESFLDDLEDSFNISRPNRRSLLNWDEIMEMSQEGISFGSHGHNHWAHASLTSAQKQGEIILSQSILQSANINYVPVFSFPSGLVDHESLAVLKHAGYKFALSASKRNTVGFDCDYLFSRVCLSQSVARDDDLLAYRLLSCKVRGELLRSI